VDSLQPWFVTCHGQGETTRQGTECVGLARRHGQRGTAAIPFETEPPTR
jgi:hypothetical protein